MSRVQVNTAVLAIIDEYRNAIEKLRDIEAQRPLDREEGQLLGSLISSKELITQRREHELQVRGEHALLGDVHAREVLDQVAATMHAVVIVGLKKAAIHDKTTLNLKFLYATSVNGCVKALGILDEMQKRMVELQDSILNKVAEQLPITEQFPGSKFDSLMPTSTPLADQVRPAPTTRQVASGTPKFDLAESFERWRQNSYKPPSVGAIEQPTNTPTRALNISYSEVFEQLANAKGEDRATFMKHIDEILMSSKGLTVGSNTESHGSLETHESSASERLDSAPPRSYNLLPTLSILPPKSSKPSAGHEARSSSTSVSTVKEENLHDADSEPTSSTPSQQTQVSDGYSILSNSSTRSSDRSSNSSTPTIPFVLGRRSHPLNTSTSAKSAPLRASSERFTYVRNVPQIRADSDFKIPVPILSLSWTTEPNKLLRKYYDVRVSPSSLPSEEKGDSIATISHLDISSPSKTSSSGSSNTPSLGHSASGEPNAQGNPPPEPSPMLDVVQQHTSDRLDVASDEGVARARSGLELRQLDSTIDRFDAPDVPRPTFGSAGVIKNLSTEDSVVTDPAITLQPHPILEQAQKVEAPSLSRNEGSFLAASQVDAQSKYIEMDDTTLHTNKGSQHGSSASNTTVEPSKASQTPDSIALADSVNQKERSSSTVHEIIQELDNETCMCKPFEKHMLSEKETLLEIDPIVVQDLLPPEWQWDVQYENAQASWTCTPLEADEPAHVPLTIARAPVVLPVEYQWPPIGGVNPPPDPRISKPIDCRATVDSDVIRDVFITFEGSVGFYLLINGMIQVLVPPNFDTSWASSHFPHRFGGLKVSYIEQTMEPTMMPTKTTETVVTGTQTRPRSQSTSLSSLFRPASSIPVSSSSIVQLNDFIEARGKSTSREKFSGRIGLSLRKENSQYILMSSHVITAAILAKPLFSWHNHIERLADDWNRHAEIWAGNEKIGTIERSFDPEAQVYPDGFQHDIALIKPLRQGSIQGIKSPVDDLGWLNRESWSSLRQKTSVLKLLGSTEATKRDAKTFRCSLCSDVLVVGEGIFLNQIATAGGKSLRQHDVSTWKSLVSRSVLYRVHPDFDPPTGYSGIALYADGTREDGTQGPGIVGFQSFVQRSGHVQHFNMEGSSLDRRLREGRVAFYGAFQVPDELRRDYDIV